MMRPRNHLGSVWLLDPERPRGLRALREVDPTVDLHYIGADQWMLGSVKPNAVRRNIAGRIKARLDDEGARTPEQYRMNLLHYDGFGHIECYSTEAVRNGAVLQDFKERDYRYRVDREAAFKEAEQRSRWRKDPQEEVDQLIRTVRDRERQLGDLVMGRKQFEPMPGVDPGGALRA